MSAELMIPGPTELLSFTVHLSAATQDQLRRQATKRGLPVEDLARAILEQEAAAADAQAAEAWAARFRAWTAAHAVSVPNVDDSRESIYD